MGRQYKTALFILFVFCYGCIITEESMQRIEARRDSELTFLRTDVERLQKLIQDWEKEKESIVKHTYDNHQKILNELANINKRIDALETKVNLIARDKEKIRNEVIDELSKKIEQMLKYSAKSSVSSSWSKGYEHTVQPGETLSKIASAYKVPLDTIIKANNITDPNSIRAGTKLFIPLQEP